LGNPQFVFGGNDPIPASRWWFVSADDYNLIQVQENFFARNWRRMTLAPDPGGEYPGFDVVRADFDRHLSALLKKRELAVSEAIKPVAVELLYDNMIHLAPHGEPLRLSDVFEPIQFSDGRLRHGMQMVWLEKFEGGTGVQNAQLQVAFAAIGAAVGGGVARPFAKLTLTARASVHDWSSVPEFFDRAHDFASERLASLTTDTIRATW
ncbi:MAG: TIGR04255 family protein, partial [Burkholderiales bacterium]